MKDNKNIFYEGMDEIDSFEAFYKEPKFVDNNFIIPYINLGISEHPLHTGKKMMYINFAWLVFIEIEYMEVFDEKTRKTNVWVNTSPPIKNINYFGGTDLNGINTYCDYGIQSKIAYLQLVSNSLVSEKSWYDDYNKTFKDITNEDMNYFFYNYPQLA